MAKIHIDKATNKQLDYAAAVALGWKKRKFKPAPMWAENGILRCWDDYEPTTDQAQCGDLIDKHGISTELKDGLWTARLTQYDKDKSRLVAAVKAFLWSKYPDGMIEVQD